MFLLGFGGAGGCFFPDAVTRSTLSRFAATLSTDEVADVEPGGFVYIDLGLVLATEVEDEGIAFRLSK